MIVRNSDGALWYCGGMERGQFHGFGHRIFENGDECSVLLRVFFCDFYDLLVFLLLSVLFFSFFPLSPSFVQRSSFPSQVQIDRSAFILKYACVYVFY